MSVTPATIQVFSTPPRSLCEIHGDLTDILNRGQEVSRDRLTEVVQDLDEYLKHPN